LRYQRTPAPLDARTLRRLRADLGLEEEELAGLVGCSRSAIHNWERTGCERPPVVLAALAAALERGCLPTLRPEASYWHNLADLFHALAVAPPPVAP
jgi:transcriptional regulator with XRE-family HTH domain